jgi:myo-inositol-1-phosphate synthase
MISFHGLDLSFLKTEESKDWLRRTRNRAIEEKRSPQYASKRSDLPAPYVMGDIAPFVSPVGETPEAITSRSALREHCKKHGVVQVGDDFKGKIVERNEARKKADEELAKFSDGTNSVEWC